jgi:DNA-binding response OmpR family regulator
MDTYSVLVVDDDEDLLDTLVARLNKRGIETVGAPSGEEAVVQMRKRRFDVVVLDIKMPGG